MFAAQAAGTASIIRNRDNRGEIGDGPFARGTPVSAAYDVLLQSAQQGGEARAAAKRDYT